MIMIPVAASIPFRKISGYYRKSNTCLVCENAAAATGSWGAHTISVYV